MRGWRRQYGEFAGPRYPGLIAYAQLLTGDRDRADALAEYALRRTFGKRRRLGTDNEVEAEIRRAIVARFLATADPEDPPVLAHAVVEKDDVGEAHVPVRQPEVDTSLYAPPGDQTFTVLHAPGTDVTDEAHEPHRPQLRAEVEMSGRVEPEQ